MCESYTWLKKKGSVYGEREMSTVLRFNEQAVDNGVRLIWSLRGPRGEAEGSRGEAESRLPATSEQPDTQPEHDETMEEHEGRPGKRPRAEAEPAEKAES